jgi:hypothetical protein
VQLLVVSVGDQALPAATERLADGLVRAGASTADVWTGRASAAGLDEALGHLDGRRLVIHADLAGLSLVLNRLMRAGLLASVETAVIPRQPVPYLHGLGLPREPAGQLRVAVQGIPRLVGVLKDDSGGLSVDRARVEPWPDPMLDRTSATSAAGTASRSGWWLRAVVDDQPLSDGDARAVDVRRLGPRELEATVQLGRFRRRSVRGRSLQLACDPARIVQDGIARERPRGKRTFWSEPELWQLAL